jgi:hypothetical protein
LIFQIYPDHLSRARAAKDSSLPQIYSFLSGNVSFLTKEIILQAPRTNCITAVICILLFFDANFQKVGGLKRKPPWLNLLLFFGFNLGMDIADPK